MAAPSKAWSAIADSQIDADSPLDTTLVTSIRDSLIHLEEWLGMSYTAAQDHDHDGVNSKYTTPSINVVRTWDDFLDPNVSEWTKTGTVGVVVPGKNGLCSSLAGATAYGGIYQTGRPWILSGPTITFETTVKHIDSTSDAFIGLSEDNTTFNNTVGFRRIGSGANWRCYTTVGGVSTDSDSGIAFATGAFKTFKIIATPTSIAFYIDGSLVATNATNIPTAAYLGVTILNYNGTTAYIDYVHCYTNSRM